ncbi:ANR family transcriptional regulator [Proteus mirabilis]|uniref:ANR family transcriptional regulator n=1 Tax=Proteus mirabilis TaxID=584 RepID=UPI003F1970CB
MKLTYLTIANQATDAEREGDYWEASQRWDKAKTVAKNKANYRWAEYRAKCNEKRYLMSRLKSKSAQINKKYRENLKLKKEAELLAENIKNTSEVHDE